MRERRDKVEKSIILAPAEAWLEDSGKDISLQFYRNLGPVKVTVTNPSGKIVYEEMVEAKVMSSWSIILNTVSKGEYMLSVVNADKILEGEFSIN